MLNIHISDGRQLKTDASLWPEKSITITVAAKEIFCNEGGARPKQQN